MKKNENNLMRVKSVLDNGKPNPNDKFLELFSFDLNRLISEFFNVKDKPTVYIKKENGVYNVEIFFTALYLKEFNNLL